MSNSLRSKWDYDPPEVSWEPTVVDGRIVGYHPEPPFGMSWPHIKTLQHSAALIEARTGIRIRVVSADGDDELFEIQTPHSCQEAKPYVGAVNWLSAFQEGVFEGGWQAKEEAGLCDPLSTPASIYSTD